MRKIISFLIAGMLCLCQSVLAQTEVNTDFNTQMNAIFGNLDKSKVPYGLLRDYAMEFTNLENYNGVAPLADSTLINDDVLWNVYKTLVTARVSTAASALVRADTMMNRRQALRRESCITLAGMYMLYARFRDDAANNYVTISNNQLFDKTVNGMWQNPYQQEAVFVLSPSVSSYNGRSFELQLPSDIWLSNNAGAISSMSINVNDGAGYRTLVPGQSLYINYADTGRKEWVYRLTLTNGGTLYTHSRVQINNSPLDAITSASSGSGGGNISLMGFRDPNPYDIMAEEAWGGGRAKGYITIDYANTDYKIRKPLIVAEGFDPGWIIEPEKQFGETDIDRFINDIRKSNSSNLNDLLQGSTQQYDIIYVDWRNGTDYIQRNALLLETVIKWVNEHKITTEPNVVLGQSMGGVVARYALRDMENKGINHQTRLFVSWDAPQQGANVPQGFQHLARHGSDLYVKAGVVSGLVEEIQLIRNGLSPYKTLNLASQPAAQQMLLNYVNENNVVDNSVHSQWQSDLNAMGYPQGAPGTPFRKVAISNGSQCAMGQAFNAGDNLFTLSGKANTSFIGDIAGMIALPFAGMFLNQQSLWMGIIPGRNDFFFDFAVNAKANNAGDEVYHGKITYTKKVLWLIPVTATITSRSYNAQSATLPYDSYAGGVYPIPFNFNSTEAQSNFLKYNITASLQPGFSFIPVCSALDIGENKTALNNEDYITAYRTAIMPAAPKNTPFDNFMTAFQDGDGNNQGHITIHGNNGNWFAAQLNGVNMPADCSAMCGSYAIDGPATIRINNSPATYKVLNLPAGVPVSWSTSDPNIATVTPTGNPATVTKTGHGHIILTANISLCGVPTAITLPVDAACYTSADYTLNVTGVGNGQPLYWCPDKEYSFSVGGAPATNFVWTVPAGWQIVSNQNSIMVAKPTTGAASGQSSVRVNIIEECGSSIPKEIVCTAGTNCTPAESYTLSPNPASSSITIKGANLQSCNIQTVQIMNTSGGIMSSQSWSGGQCQVTIAVSYLNPGSYVAKVYNGSKWYMLQFMKQ